MKFEMQVQNLMCYLMIPNITYLFKKCNYNLQQSTVGHMWDKLFGGVNRILTLQKKINISSLDQHFWLKFDMKIPC